MDVRARTLYPGDRLAHVGVLVACEPGAGPLRGLAVRVEGTALARGLVEVTRARARPWSARLAPWEASGWEHSLDRVEGDARGCVLRSARVEHGAVRKGLAHAVWVELEGRAVSEGEGVLAVCVTPVQGGAGEVWTRVPLRVRALRPREVLSAYLAWTGTLADNAVRVRAALDGFARAMSALRGAGCSMQVRGVSRVRAANPAAWVSLGERGVRGGAQWQSLWRALRRGSLESLSFTAPGASARDAVLDAAVAQCGEGASAVVDLVFSVGRERVASATRAALVAKLSGVVRAGDAVRGWVAEHDWVESVAEMKPWEGRAGGAPARDVFAMVLARDAVPSAGADDAGAWREETLADGRVWRVRA